jgi:hypothetical protein
MNIRCFETTFQILLLAPEYNLEIQVQIPTVLAAIQNFIHSHDLKDMGPRTANDSIIHYNFSSGDEAGSTVAPEEAADERWDQIAQAMWDDYLCVCEERGIGLDDSDDSILDSDEDS